MPLKNIGISKGHWVTLDDGRHVFIDENAATRDEAAIKTEIEVEYRIARDGTIAQAAGKNVHGGTILAVDAKDANALKSKAAAILGEAKSTHDVHALAIKHGLIKEVD